MKRVTGRNGESDDREGRFWREWVDEKCGRGRMDAELIWAAEESDVECQGSGGRKDAFSGSGQVELSIADVLELSVGRSASRK